METPGPSACKADALPLRYTPTFQQRIYHFIKIIEVFPESEIGQWNFVRIQERSHENTIVEIQVIPRLWHPRTIQCYALGHWYLTFIFKGSKNIHRYISPRHKYIGESKIVHMAGPRWRSSHEKCVNWRVLWTLPFVWSLETLTSGDPSEFHTVSIPDCVGVSQH